MRAISRVDDKNSGGGQLMTGASNTFINQKPVALHPSKITPHPKKHNNEQTTEGSPNIFVEGKPVVLVTNGNTCGHTIVEGSENTFTE